MKLIYVAGPFTARLPNGELDYWGIEQNIRRAEAVGYEMARLGAMPVIPHTNTRGHFCQVQGYEFWIDGTLELLRRCDAVVMADGWLSSNGAIGELREAQRLGKPIFYPSDREAIAAWIAEDAGAVPAEEA